MKKLYFLLIPLFFSFTVNAQCVATLNVYNQGICDSSCAGVVSIQISNGLMPATVYADINGVPQMPVSVTSVWQQGNLCAGDMINIVVIDSNGDTCIADTTFFIQSFPSPDAQATIINASCSSCVDGSAMITVTGGTPPYSYLWSTGNTTSYMGLLAPGIYMIYVTDANGCLDMDTVIIGVGANGYFPLTGQVYLDMNSNGVKDGGETGIASHAVELTPGNITALTNYSGDFGFAVPPGIYDITYQTTPGWLLTSSPGSYNLNVSGAVSNLDFGVYPDSSFGSATLTMWGGWPRCFFNVPYLLVFNNTGFTPLNGTLTFTYDPSMTYVSSSVPPATQIGNVITYDFVNLQPGQSLSITATFTLPGAGAVLPLTLNATGSDGVGYNFNIDWTMTHIVTCSYDPNDKAVQPEGQGPGNYVPMNTDLDYMIRFQNTGTDTAFTVILVDTLDADLDMNTFSFLGSSHNATVTLNGNIATFTFDGIFLPDSNVNEPASHGYVLYRIKGNIANPDPTEATNTAYIYFDQNSPVQTNTTLTTFSDNWLSIIDPSPSENLFDLFPNPAHDEALLRLKSSTNVNYTITITDITGKKVFGPESLMHGSILLQTHKLLPGTYTVEAKPENGKPVHLRMVKQ